MKSKVLIISLGLLAVYFITHLVGLTKLPVFADESIYIRWSQLILDDPGRYLFFPLNDGKTPLFIWLLAPFQLLFADQLFAARVVAVIIGALQVLALGYLAYLVSSKVKTAWLAMIWTIVLPFWFFYHRMALIDGFLTLWLTLLLIGLIKLNRLLARPNQTQSNANIQMVGWTLLTGVSLGLAILSKLPGILFIPTLGLFGWWLPNTSKKSSFTQTQRFHFWLLAGVSLVIGLGMFGLLRLHPAFGQLFSRGNDFLYPWREVFLEGAWRQTLPNSITYFNDFLVYLTWPIISLVAAGLFLKPHQRTNHILFWSAVSFLLPIAVLGRVVYPRYLLPAAVFFTVIAAVSVQDIVEIYIKPKALLKKIITSLLLVILLANSLAISGVFMLYALTNPNQLPLVSADKVQYLTEWSSGHGITETVESIRQQAKTGSLAVATEGYFGTLPDGLLLYFHRQNVENIYIEGIGQPVVTIPSSFTQRAQNYDQVWLVVNSHRLDMKLEPDTLLAEYCRPYAAPCLQVWDITTVIK